MAIGMGRRRACLRTSTTLLALALALHVGSAFMPSPFGGRSHQAAPAVAPVTSQRPPLSRSVTTDPLLSGEMSIEDRAAAAAALEEAANAPTRPVAGDDDAFALAGGGRTFPLSMIVGQDSIKTALLLSAVNRDMGGVVISGGRGTAKSVMARALHRLVPPIERVEGSLYNVDPSAPEYIDTFLRDELAQTGKPIAEALAELPTEVVDAPFVQVPLNVMDDMLLGSIDVEASVKTGKSVFQPGLLARAHRGVLYVDDLNLLDQETSNVLLQVVSDGFVLVEREGISVRYPCRPLLIATFNPEEGELREHLLDRIAVALSADAAPLDVNERVAAVDAVSGFADQSTPADKLADAIAAEDALRNRIIFAREDLPDIKLKPEQLTYLCEEASRAGCQGQRAEIFAVEVARASAALEDRPVGADDLRLAVRLAIAPRGTYINDPDTAEDMMPPPPPPPPPQQQQQEDQEQEQDQEDQDRPDQEEQESEDEAPEEPEEEEMQLPEEFMFDAEGTPIDPELINFANKQRSGRSGGRGLIFSQERGRYIKAMLPRGNTNRLAVDATMRAAAPYQRARRARAAATPQKPGARQRSVYIEGSDVRSKKMARKAGSLILFVVDASGSMALNRMQAAKGAALSLLTEAYQSRDMISLVPFQGNAAQVLVPPTRSIAMTKKRLETMPCGGGSPLAHAISVACKTGLNAMKTGDVGKCVIVCISDGRANVPLAVSMGEEEAPPPGTKPDRQALKDELLEVAKQVRAIPSFSLLMIDTENKFVSTGLAKEIADCAGGNYHKLPKMTQEAIAGVASGAIADLRNA